jgi:glutathione S-transferase
MTVELYDLVGSDDRRFSSNCWRSRFALAHKGLAVRTRPVRFVDIAGIGGGHRTVPVLRDGDLLIGDSARIARHLEATYPTPSLFGAGAGRAYAAHLETWLPTVLSPALLRVIVLDLHARLDPADRAYFRESRERRFGMTLEAYAAGPREERVDAVRGLLAPVRAALGEGAFLGGAGPLYPDYLVAAALMWPRAMSPGPLLAADDPILVWFARMLALFDGLGRTAAREWDGP